MRKIKTQQFYQPAYNDEFPAQQYYLFLFNKFPSVFSDKTYYNCDIIDFLKKNEFVIHNEIDIARKNFRSRRELMYVHEKFEIIIILDLSTEEKNNLILIKIFYNIIDKGQEYFNFIKKNIIEYKENKKKFNISLVKSDLGTLDTEEYDINIPDVDLELNYGKEFLKIHDVIINRLNTDNDKGIIILRGVPGGGKTYYIRYLTTLIKNKEILFIPPSMASMLSDPSIIPFLMEKRNSILIIEDGEKVIKDREINGETAAAVSNLLNLTDGILGDCLNIQVIITFNIKREKIDEALLRKSRLICEWEFTPLNVENSNKLLKKLFPHKNYITNTPLPLSDIYTFDVENFAITNNQTKIGF